ncbi:MAG: hypothetical protein E6H48_11055 [Betaproteobacteria bacterium]|nr:MAG: hypothetical protein E6H48_11055 [Betaproteobacteria bacterium]
MPSATQNFAGLSFTDSCVGGTCGAGWPPDPNGDVGPNHYIQAVNDAYAIYNKTGTLLAAFTEDQLWSGIGTSPCNGNSQGDPIVIYDELADRWILTHFAFAFSGPDPVAPFYQCIAVSQTNDPVAGGWYFYALQMDPGGAGKPPAGTFNDYGKFGIWTDCLYMAANGFNANTSAFVGSLFASFSRADMYSGASLTWSLGFINNTTDPFTMIPANLSGKAALAVPAGAPNYFVSESQTTFAFEVRKFTPGANCGAGGTLSAATNVSQASYAIPSASPNIAQPNTSNKLDNLGDRLMQKVQYRKVGAAESVWVVHNVQGSPPSRTVRPQWAQLNVTGQVIATAPVQQQIYVPDSTLHRWMGSLAVDAEGNMALGYSTSSGSVPNFPSIAYSGRLASDALNMLPQTETQLVAGAGSQTNNCGGSPCDRWGDYTAMSVDPADDCTFWYTNEYYSSQANGSSGNWQTRIGAFKFPGCTAASAPTVTTGAASGITAAGATLNGTVSSDGAITTVTFQYGPTASYGSTATAAQSPLAPSASGVAVSAAVTGLNCNATYHFRAVGANTAGTTNGGDATFATAACSSNANLANLALSAGTLSPTFASGTLSYSANVVSNNNTMTVTPTTANATATVRVNGVAVASGSPSGPITLSTGSNVITVVVTAQDGVTTKTYTINVNYLPLSSCTYSLSPLDLSNTAAAGGIANITVTTPNGCPVTATSFQPWVNVNSIIPTGGTTTVQLQISANAGTARATSIVVADRLFLITQNGP